VQDADKVTSFKHKMNTLAYGEAMLAAARDYGEVCTTDLRYERSDKLLFANPS
jgi:hypothetical protein